MEEFLEKLNKEELSGSCRDWARSGLLVECCKAGQLSEPSSWMAAHTLDIREFTTDIFVNHPSDWGWRRSTPWCRSLGA